MRKKALSTGCLKSGREMYYSMKNNLEKTPQEKPTKTPSIPSLQNHQTKRISVKNSSAQRYKPSHDVPVLTQFTCFSAEQSCSCRVEENTQDKCLQTEQHGCIGKGGTHTLEMLTPMEA